MKTMYQLVLFVAVLACAGWAEAHTTAKWDRVMGDVSTDNPQGDVDHYDVYACLGATACSAGTFSKTATVPQVAPPVPPATTAAVTWTLTPGTTGILKVRAVDKSGNESADSLGAAFDRNPPQPPAVSVQ